MPETRAAFRCITHLTPASLRSLSNRHPGLDRADPAEWNLALTAGVAVLVAEAGSIPEASIMKAMVGEFGEAGREEVNSCTTSLHAEFPAHTVSADRVLTGVAHWIAEHYERVEPMDCPSQLALEVADVAAGFADALTNWAESAPSDRSHDSNAALCLDSVESPGVHAKVLLAKIETKDIEAMRNNSEWSGPHRLYSVQDVLPDISPVLIVPVDPSRIEEVETAIRSVLEMLDAAPPEDKLEWTRRWLSRN